MMSCKNSHPGAWVLVTGLLLISACRAPAAAADLDATPISRDPYVQMATSDSIWVVWRTRWSNIKPVVRYGRTPEALDEKVSGRSIVVRTSLKTNKHLSFPQLSALRTRKNLRLPQLHSAPTGTFQYEARIRKLDPATVYYYALYDGDRRLTPVDASYRFTTYPLKGTAKPVRFWAWGDSGTARPMQRRVYQAMLDVTRKENRPMDLLLHVGDMAYMDGYDVEFQTRFFNPYAPTLRHTVCWPALANHEGHTSKGTTGIGPYFDAYVLPAKGEAGGVASGLEACYSFDFGRVHFICLDSYDLRQNATDRMKRWLKADLAQTKADQKTDWLIAFFHHAPYTKGTHDSDKEKELVEMRKVFMPILEQGGVDLVLTGHSHIYERSMLMDGAYGDTTSSDNHILDDGDGSPFGDGAYRKSAGLNPHEGTVQVVTGHSGTTVGRKGTMPVMEYTAVVHGSVIVDIDGDTLTGAMIDAYGDRLDQFNIVKRGQVLVRHMPKPWLPPKWDKPDHWREDGFDRQPPEPCTVAIPPNARWQYLAGGRHPKSAEWMWPGFDAGDWKTGAAGFGYKYPNVRTELSDMKGNYTVVYLRREFTISQADAVTDISLMIDYDDAFVAFLNGGEVLRKGVGRSSGTRAQNIANHTANGHRHYLLNDINRYLLNGTNVLAIVGHNNNLDSSDLLLDPYLLVEE